MHDSRLRTDGLGSALLFAFPAPDPGDAAHARHNNAGSATAFRSPRMLLHNFQSIASHPRRRIAQLFCAFTMPSDLSFKERVDKTKPVLAHTRKFNLDAILGLPVLKPKVAIWLIPALAYWHDKRQLPITGGLSPKLPLREHLKELLFVKYKWAGRLFLFTLLRLIHGAATRYVKNHGYFFGDKPDWSRDVVVITGGSAGIGRAVVELLTWKHRARVAVLDVSAPTYAPAPPGAPEILYIKTDITDPAAVKKAGEEIKARFGRAPSYLINNAGIAAGDTILKTDLPTIEKTWKVSRLFREIAYYLSHLSDA